jgi:hypothetical protein
VIPQPNDPYALLLTKLHAIEQDLALLREELADLRVRVGEAGFDGRP